MLLGTVLTVVVVLTALTGAAWVLQRHLIYLPDRTEPSSAALPGAQDVTLRTTDGLSLSAWHVPGPSGAPTVLVAPGNGGNRAGRSELARGLGDRGLGVLLLDYRGYGGNPGSPTQAGLARDVRAARTFLVQEAGVAPEDLVYLGESLGAAVVSELATEHPPAALVLRSPFISLAEAGRAAYGVPVGWLLRDRYPVRELVRDVRVPVVVVAGAQDTIVPPAQSRAV
ncbi:alpha/beta fold hydrolase, partial [Georgenia sp. 10Sc9-8]|nr:alpha/beta fold hydrolase [Georgenia halotolerans]